MGVLYHCDPLLSYGECGRLPPSVFCHINTLCVAHGLLTLPAHTLVQSVYSELERLHHQGFETWVSKVHEMAHAYGVRTSGNTVEFEMHYQSQVNEHFINEWHDDLSARERPFLRTYRLFKSSFGPESYSFNVKDQRYWAAITKIRASSHVLEIERGRYSKPMVPSHFRMCKKCYVVENEKHFVTKSVININERNTVIIESSVFSLILICWIQDQICIPGVLCRQTNSEMVWEIYTPILYNS